MLNSRKTQATLFIILVAIIFLVLIILLVLNTNTLSSVNFITPSISKQQSNQVKNYLELCLTNAMQESLVLLGRGGMLYEATSFSQEIFSIEYKLYSDNSSDIIHLIDIIPYYIIDGSQIMNNMPSIKSIEEEYSKSINQLFMYCATKNNSFEKQGIQLMILNNSIKLSIIDDAIIAGSESPIKITKNNKTLSEEEIYSILNYNFIEKYNFVHEFIEYQLSSMEYAEIGYLLDLAYENDFTFSTNYIEEGIMRYDFIFDDYTQISGEPFVYSFLIDYRWENEN